MDTLLIERLIPNDGPKFTLTVLVLEQPFEVPVNV